MRLFLALLLASSAAIDALAYVRSSTGNVPTQGQPLARTDFANIQFLVNDTVKPGASNAEGEVMITPGSDPVAAMSNAVSTWSGVTSSKVHFASPTSTTLQNDARDRNHVVTFEDTPENRSIVGSFLAITVVQYSGSGAILDSDIIFNPRALLGGDQMPFSTTAEMNTFDLQSVLTHELGHALGANHSGIIGATMYQTSFVQSQFATFAESTAQSTLSTDDVAFLTEAYPADNAKLQVGTIAGAVRLNDGTPVKGALIVAVDVSTGTIVGGLSNFIDGTYAIGSVPIGNYQVYAEPLDGPVGLTNLASSSLRSGLDLSFRTSFFGGTAAPGNVPVGGGSTSNADISVDTAPSNGNIQFIGAGPGGTTQFTYSTGGSVKSIAGGGSLEVYIFSKGVDANSTIRVLGPGLSVRTGSVRTVPTGSINGIVPLHFTLDAAPVATRSLATIVVLNGTDAAAYSGGLLVLPGPASFSPAGLVNAASFASAGGISPGEIFTIFGTQFGSSNLYTLRLNSGKVDTLVAGTRVLFDGVPAPMIYVIRDQLSGIVPYSVAVKSSTNVQVEWNGARSQPVSIPVSQSAPALFTIPAVGSGQGAILNQDGTVNSRTNPAKIGSVVVLFGTGEGQTTPRGVDGQLAGAPLPKPQLPVTVKIGGVTAPVSYAGSAPTLVAGVLQVNVTISSGITPGPNVPVSISIGNSSSQDNVTLAVAQ